MLRYLTFKRELVFVGIAIVALVAGGVGYFVGLRSGEIKARQIDVPTLSANDVETVEHSTAPAASSGNGDVFDQVQPTQKAKSSSADPYASIAQPINIPTGTRIAQDRNVSGRGKLKAINGTSFDACVSILNDHTQQRIRSVYIKASDSFSFDRIEPGNYRIVYTTGTAWDNNARQFSQNASYFEFGKILDFQDQDGMVDRYTITLHEVLNGNVHARQLSQSEFRSLNAIH